MQCSLFSLNAIKNTKNMKIEFLFSLVTFIQSHMPPSLFFLTEKKKIEREYGECQISECRVCWMMLCRTMDLQKAALSGMGAGDFLKVSKNVRAMDFFSCTKKIFQALNFFFLSRQFFSPRQVELAFLELAVTILLAYVNCFIFYNLPQPWKNMDHFHVINLLDSKLF